MKTDWKMVEKHALQHDSDFRCSQWLSYVSMCPNYTHTHVYTWSLFYDFRCFISHSTLLDVYTDSVDMFQIPALVEFMCFRSLHWLSLFVSDINTNGFISCKCLHWLYLFQKSTLADSDHQDCEYQWLLPACHRATHHCAAHVHGLADRQTGVGL